MICKLRGQGNNPKRPSPILSVLVKLSVLTIPVSNTVLNLDPKGQTISCVRAPERILQLNSSSPPPFIKTQLFISFLPASLPGFSFHSDLDNSTVKSMMSSLSALIYTLPTAYPSYQKQNTLASTQNTAVQNCFPTFISARTHILLRHVSVWGYFTPTGFCMSRFAVSTQDDFHPSKTL